MTETKHCPSCNASWTGENTPNYCPNCGCGIAVPPPSDPPMSLEQRCDFAESSHLLLKATLEQITSDCAPYLKEGETIAECVVRNREDVQATVVLLSRELQRAERAEAALIALQQRVDGTVAWLRDRIASLEIDVARRQREDHLLKSDNPFTRVAEVELATLKRVLAALAPAAPAPTKDTPTPKGA